MGKRVFSQQRLFLQDQYNIILDFYFLSLVRTGFFYIYFIFDYLFLSKIFNIAASTIIFNMCFHPKNSTLSDFNAIQISNGVTT